MKNSSCQPGLKYSNYKGRRERPILTLYGVPKMIIKIAACLLALGFFAACQSTTTTKRETLREMNSRYASNENVSSTVSEPAPPAEGPEDVPPDRSMDPIHNPALVPSPLLRENAAADP